MPKHYLIFIHGIGELQEGELQEKDSPLSSYNTLWNRLIKKSGVTSEEFSQQFGRIDVIWHMDELYDAEHALFQASFPDLKTQKFCLMSRLREFMTFFIGDVAAYVSEDVNFIRRTAWEKIWLYEDSGKPFKQLLEEGATYSILAHSLGTVIAFDYLFHLFNPVEATLFVPEPNVQQRPEDGLLTSQDKDLADESARELQLLQTGFRHFFSMGSPISLFLMRKGSLWSKIKLDANEPFEPFTSVYNPVREGGRVWCNFWDRHDPIAYPVAQVFKKNPKNDACTLMDVEVETGWILRAHVDYWKNNTVATTILKWVTKKD